MLPSKIKAEAQYKGRYKMNIRLKNAVKTIFIVTVLTRNIGCDKTQDSSNSVTAPSNDNQQAKIDNNPNNNYTQNEPLPNEPHNSAQTGHNGEYDPKNHYDSPDNAYDLGHNGGNPNTDYDSHHYSGNSHQYSGNANTGNSNEYAGNGNQNTGNNNQNTGNSNQNTGNNNQYTGNNNQYTGGNPFNSFAGGINNLNSAYLNARHFSANSNTKSRLSNKIIQTRYGKLQGVVVPMDEHKFLKPVEVFLGVPYATPPVGSNRFSPTRTPSPWDGIRISDASGPACPQKLPDIRNESAALERMPKGRLEYLKRLLPYLRNQSEDCLYMNIYTPVQGRQT